jgi:hypothetical protein
MKSSPPSRIALALIGRFVPDSDPLIGDLIEEFNRRPSNVRLWLQVLAALAAAWTNRDREIRPLKLMDEQPADAIERTRRFQMQFPPVNLTGSPIPGVGGLGLVALGLIVLHAAGVISAL